MDFNAHPEEERWRRAEVTTTAPLNLFTQAFACFLPPQVVKLTDHQIEEGSTDGRSGSSSSSGIIKFHLLNWICNKEDKKKIKITSWLN
jgi:hypothetical protein